MKNWVRHLLGKPNDVDLLRNKLASFRTLVENNSLVLNLIAGAGEKLGGEYIFDIQYVRSLEAEISEAVRKVVYHLSVVTGKRDPDLDHAMSEIESAIRAMVESRIFTPKADMIIPLDEVSEELAEVVGYKMARLGELKNRLGCSVPDGFVVSADACRRLLEHTDLSTIIAGLSHVEDNQERIESWSEQCVETLAKADLMPSLVRAIRKAARKLVRKAEYPLLAVRSSAVGEDGKQSHAGQYTSVLGVAAGDVIEAYRKVVASLFSTSVMAYRRAHGLHPGGGLMAVGCLRMVAARAGGVIYTLDPSAPERDVLMVSVTVGLGTMVVEGSAPVDRFEVSRQAPHRVVWRSVARKEHRVWVAEDRGLTRSALAEAERDQPAVTDVELAQLAGEALRIERFMKCAQDIEWAIDGTGRLSILQARPLFVSMPAERIKTDLSDLEDEYQVLLKKVGTVACRGIGCGPVHVLDAQGEPAEVPRGAVLVSRTSTPRLAAAVTRASAIITDFGTVTGHLAAIAREFRVPMVVDTRIATTVLANTGEVTVDGEENIVYQGRVPPLLRAQLLRSSSFEDAPEFCLLRRVLRRIAPLNLKDPQSPNFAAANCTTYHDVIRYAHEQAILALEGGQAVRASTASSQVRRLDLGIPLGLTIVDLGGGMVSRDRDIRVTPDDIRCRPLTAIIEGLQTRGVWSTDPTSMDLEGFMSSITRSGSVVSPVAARPQQNLALVSREYLHLSVKLGYHYTVVDSYLEERQESSFIYFRFAGGVTEMTRRSRRAALLKRILGHYDFVVEGKGDLVIGRIKNLSGEHVEDRLRMIGRLIGFTRQLDILLRNDAQVEEHAQRFFAGLYGPLDTRPVMGPAAGKEV